MKGSNKMENHTIVELMSATMQKIREMVEVDTIVGKAISTPDGTTIIPVSKVSFGFGAGGGDVPLCKNEAKPHFGGGSGAGVKIMPVAFLIVNGETVKLLPVSPPAGSSVDRALEMLPEAIDKIIGLFKKDDGDIT
jgi:sporulation protein YtfJ